MVYLPGTTNLTPLHLELKCWPFIIAIHEPAMADLKPCPLTQIPTEILQVIASRLDKTSLSALRLTGREVKERIEFVFKGGFREIKHNILDCEYDDDDLCAFIMKDLEFLKTEYPSKVEVVTWVVKFALFDVRRHQKRLADCN